jgi:hypothetical protein
VNKSAPLIALNLLTYLEQSRRYWGAGVGISVWLLDSKYFRQEGSLVILRSPLTICLGHLPLLANQSPPPNQAALHIHLQDFRY